MYYTATGELKNNILIEDFSDIKRNKKKTYKMITPATFINFFDKTNVAIVNTLQNNFFITKKPFRKSYLNLYYPGEEFLEMEEKKI